MQRVGNSGYTLLEVLVVSMLLAFFLVSFYEGTARMSEATITQQNRNEALMQSRRVGHIWRSGATIKGLTQGHFLNGTSFTIDHASKSYTASGSSLTRMSVTIGWKEVDPLSTGAKKQRINDVYFRY